MANMKNLAADLVAVAPSPATSGTTLDVRSGRGAAFPTTPFFATLTPQGQLSTTANSEIVSVTNISTDTLTIVRAQKGTTAQSIGVNWVISNAIYAEDMAEKLVNSNNLSDVSSASTSRTNLGLGSLATKSTVTLTTDVTGILPVANGGTGVSSLTTSMFLTSNGSGTEVNSVKAIPAGQVLGTTDTQTVSNKWVVKRVVTLTAGTSYTPNGDTTDLVIISAPTGNYTINAPSGTPGDGQVLIVRQLTGATAYTPTFNAIYAAGNGQVMPTVYPVSSTVDHVFIYDLAKTKWVLHSVDIPNVAYVPMQISAYRRVSAATTVTSTDGLISADATSGAYNVTLPTASTVPGRAFSIKKWNTSANDVTVVGTIDSATNYTLTGSTRPSITVFSNGTDWELI